MEQAFNLMEPPILDLRGVSYRIGGKLILSRISWQLRKGEHWAILDPNGAGKTTLLKIACGYLWPNGGGTIYRNGQALVDLRQLRESIGWVTASLLADVPPAETVIRTVASGRFAQLGLRDYAGHKQHATDIAQAHQCLSEMGCAHLANREFGTLSQGEKQRVLISRARMARPLLLILDEPCAGLDPGGREMLLESIQNLAASRQDIGLVLVTQHIEEITPIFENVLVLSGGKIIEKGPAEQVISAQLLQRLYGVSARIVRSADRYWMIRD
jgi:iron complex transport system ATP-binding protein